MGKIKKWEESKLSIFGGLITNRPGAFVRVLTQSSYTFQKKKQLLKISQLIINY